MTRPPVAWPAAVQRLIAGAELQRDTVGESPCSVWHFERASERFFVKHSPAAYSGSTFCVRREAELIAWLQPHLRVPELLLSQGDEQGHTMVVRAVPGRPLAEWLQQPERVIDAFAQALAELQAVPLADCPFDSRVALRLAELERLLARGHVAGDAQVDAWPGVASPAQLLAELQRRRPAEDLVFSHGDLGDSNLFVDAQGRLAYIDLGRGGRADRWLDIAFACRNLREELGAAAVERLLARLPLPDEPDKRRYFEALDELF